MTRRVVLGVSLAVLLVLLVPPAPAQDKVEGNRYTNARYGIEIGKPAKWYFITAATILDLARKTAGATAPRVEDPIQAAGFAVVISKVPSLGRAVDPQVILLVHDTPKAPTDLVQACEGLRTGMVDPETVAPTRQVQLDGKPAARLDFKGFVDGTAVRATALCTFRDRRAYVAVGQALAADFDAEAPTFETILQSLHVK